MQSSLMKTIDIVEFDSQFQDAVENLVLPIQQVEFGVPITREDQPDLMDICGQFRQGKGNFWVALREGQVVGSIGVVDIGNDAVALKKMFVHRDCRGCELSVAARLMERAKSWCGAHGIKEIFLGTTEQMTAAQRFYQKNGFVELAKAQLPPNFPIVAVDNRFYKCHLTSSGVSEV